MDNRVRTTLGLRAVFFLGVLLSVGCGAFGIGDGPAFLTFISPAGTYTVTLKGNPERPRFGENTVKFDVAKAGQTYIANEFLHSGDSMDPSFSVGYPIRSWESESVIRFYREDSSTTKETVLVNVVNESGLRLKVVKVFTSDKCLLFDVPPHVTSTFAVSKPKGDFIEFYLEGEYEDGERFAFGSVKPFLSDHNTQEFFISIPSRY